MDVKSELYAAGSGREAARLELRLADASSAYDRERYTDALSTLKELVRSYLTITKDVGRVMTRVKALYRSWAIPCTGKQIYAPVIAPNG